MTEIFLEVKNGIKDNANGFANYLCVMIRKHLEQNVVGIAADEKWEDGSPAQIVFKVNLNREDADKLVDELNEEGDFWVNGS
jgi:hypothetical protein